MILSKSHERSARTSPFSQDELSVYDAARGLRLAHLHSENRWGACWMPEDGRSVLAGGAEGTLQVLRRAD